MARKGGERLAPTSLSPSGQVSVSLALSGGYTILIDPQGSGFGTHQLTLAH
jgi:hypothetical protein